MTSREQFEEHFSWTEVELRSEGGRYLDASVQLHWLTWQASRQALVVELPPIGTPSAPGTAWHNVRNNTIEACGRAIEAAGVRVTP